MTIFVTITSIFVPYSLRYAGLGYVSDAVAVCSKVEIIIDGLDIGKIILDKYNLI